MVFTGWKLYAPSTVNDSRYFINTVQLEINGKSIHEVFVTNYMKLWKERFTEEDILKIMLDSNKDVEVHSEATFMQIGFKILTDLDDICKKTIKESIDGVLNVAVVRKSSFVLKMNFSLALCSVQEFFSTITRPMLSIIDDLKESETQLRNLIKKKDFELEEYFRETNNVYSMMKCFTTPKYDDKGHMAKHNAMAAYFGDDTDGSLSVKPKDILKLLQLPKLQNEVRILSPDLRMDVKRERIKTEPETNTTTKTESAIITDTKSELSTINSPLKTEGVGNTHTKIEPAINKAAKTESTVNIPIKTEPEINITIKTEPEKPTLSQTSDQNPELVPTLQTQLINIEHVQSLNESPKKPIESTSQKNTPGKRKKLNY